jgi:hypothetical protein
MSKRSHQPASPAHDSQRLVVWGELRKDPDWDAFVAALVDFVLNGDDTEDEGDRD